MPRYVVIDLNVLDVGLHRFLNEGDHAVLALDLFSDIAGNHRREKHIRMLPKWFRWRRNQIHVARDLSDIVRIEAQTRKPISGATWRDESITHGVRNRISDPNLTRFLIEEFPKTVAFSQYEEHRATFVGCCELFAQFSRDRNPDAVNLLIHGPFFETARDIVQTPEFGAFWPRFFLHGYNNTAWKERLSVFPDSFAVGRWSRMLTWYGLCLAGNRNSRFENNYEDAAHGLAASYAGNLATLDAGLQEMVHAVFPSVQIVRQR